MPLFYVLTCDWLIRLYINEQLDTDKVRYDQQRRFNSLCVQVCA